MLPQQACYFGDHKAADPVVKGPADQVAIRQFGIAVLIGDHRSDMHTELFQLFFIAGAAIQKEIVHSWLRVLGIGVAKTGMDGGPAKNGRYQPLFTMNEYALRGRDL